MFAVVLLIAIGAAVWLMQPQDNSFPKKLKVVAAENTWGNLAAQIGGDDVDVTSIITDPNADPHLYESSAQNAAAIAQADVVIVNGLGYDDFMNKLLDASPNVHRSVVTIAHVLGAHNGDNPHFWYDLSRLNQITEAIQSAFSSQKPAAAARFTTNAASLSQALKPMFDRAALIKQRYAGVPVVYTERVPGYMLPVLGLNNKTPTTFAGSIENGNEPSPADQSTMQNLIAARQVRLLFYNSQASSPATVSLRNMAAQANVPVVAVAETLPAHATYQSWMESQLDAIRAALDNTK